MTTQRQNAPFLKACRQEKTPFTPVWLLRQAGRYMKEYRALRAKVSFLELCKTPELACEVTVHAQEKIGADAAIIFSDILLITESLGFHLEFNKGEGPVISNPYEGPREFKPFDVNESLGFVPKAIALTRAALKPDIPLIGFAGAPLTVASYAIEGGKSKDFAKTKALMKERTNDWNALLSAIAEGTSRYLKAQIDAGADAIQLFDSWVGIVSEAEYREHVLPHVRSIFESLPKETPTIHFGTNSAHLLSAMKEAGGTVIGLDYRVQLDEMWSQLGDVAIQGNFDPNVLLSDRSAIKKEALRVLEQARGRPGHIFNVGHGILPTTPVENVQFLIDFVHEASSR